jgi:glyoxylase-like metal-dependent hydrolase (beta-lactamase superfamily II)
MAGQGYEVYAVKYAERQARRSEHFIGGDPHDGPMPMDYYVWAIVGADRTLVVDTGFEELDAERRKRTLVRSVSAALASVGVDAATTTEVILTHFHYDHIGGVGRFPQARFHVQDAEMSFATGRHMTRAIHRHGLTLQHVQHLVQAVYDGRVVFHDGDDELAPGISLHLIGGHTAGMQAVRVETQTGTVVLASDCTHYYENMEAGRPFPIVFDVGAMVEGYDTLRRLAGPGGWIVPGHDPLVLDRFRPAGEDLAGVAVRLDEPLG